LAGPLGDEPDADQRLDPAVRAVRLPEGDVPAGHGSGVSKSAASRRFVALSTEKLDALMNADLSDLDLLVIQIDGLHVSDDLVLRSRADLDRVPAQAHKARPARGQAGDLGCP